MPGATGIVKRNIPSIVTLLTGVFVFLSIPDQIAVFESEGAGSVNARTVPYLIAGLIIVLSFSMIVSDIVGSRGKEESQPETGPREATSYFRAFLAFAAITAWILALPYLGYNFATILLVIAIMSIVGDCRWWQIALLSLILSFPVSYLLSVILRVYLPGGSLFG